MDNHINEDIGQRNPLKQLLEYDRNKAISLVKKAITKEAYDFATKIGIDWNESDILRQAKTLAIKVASLENFGETFDELISQIEGDRQ